jgi:hypothetical protein
MSRTLSNLNTRLAKVEEQVAHLARRQKLANCNCYPDPLGMGMLVVKDAEEFKTEMNLSCPVHGFRRLGKLMVVRTAGLKGELLEAAVRCEELVAEYKRGLAEYLKSNPELRDDHDEI